jgi:hypothetical protein
MNDVRLTVTGRTGRLLIAVVAAMATVGASTAIATAAPAAAPHFQAKIKHGGTASMAAAKSVLSALGLQITCAKAGVTPAATGTAAIPSGLKHGPAPLQIGTISKLSVTNCTGPLGKVRMVARALPYAINVNSTTDKKGQTDVSISGVTLSVSMPSCAFTLSGSMPGYYTNSAHILTLTPNLPVKPGTSAVSKVSNVKGCAGLVHSRRLKLGKWLVAFGMGFVIGFVIAVILIR